MNRKETYKYYIKSKLDRENDVYNTTVKVKGDYYEALMFAVEEVVTALIEDVGMSKKEFLTALGATYDVVKKGDEENGN